MKKVFHKLVEVEFKYNLVDFFYAVFSNTFKGSVFTKESFPIF